MKDLLVLLGKRVHDLRVARKWSQEEFAHVSGLHRTYIGQIERGEKNISFGNLVKIASTLGVTAAELLTSLESDVPLATSSAKSRASKPPRAPRTLEVQKLAKQLQVQRNAMDRTMRMLEAILASAGQR